MRNSGVASTLAEVGALASGRAAAEPVAPGEAHLVEDLPRLLVVLGIVADALAGGEAERACRAGRAGRTRAPGGPAMRLSRPKRATNHGMPAAIRRRPGSSASGMASVARSAAPLRHARPNAGGSLRTPALAGGRGSGSRPSPGAVSYRRPQARTDSRTVRGPRRPVRSTSQDARPGRRGGRAAGRTAPRSPGRERDRRTAGRRSSGTVRGVVRASSPAEPQATHLEDVGEVAADLDRELEPRPSRSPEPQDERLVHPVRRDGAPALDLEGRVGAEPLDVAVRVEARRRRRGDRRDQVRGAAARDRWSRGG